MVNVVDSAASQVDADLLAVLVGTNDDASPLASLSEAAGVDIASLAAEEGFKADVGQTLVLRALGGIACRRVVLIGIGAATDIASGSLRRAGVVLARKGRELRTSRVACAAHGLDAEACAQVIQGFRLGAYKFDRYRSKKDDEFEGFGPLTLAGAPPDGAAAMGRAESIGAAVNLARDLVNEIPNVLFPEELAARAQSIASEYQLECTIFDESRLHDEGFNLIMAVGKGSEHPPRLVHLVYRPSGEVKERIAFVGKGVTFDTGGYNLKPGAALLRMHSDMAGAAAVLGAARAIGELAPPGVEVHFVVPSAENAVANNAFKPQDIFRGYGGKTVEIHNTDAEGRLILADALAYIQTLKPDVIVDLATLTGACVVALGEHTAAVFSDDDELVDDLLSAASLTGEDYWRMPLTKKLDKLLDTPMADMKNVGPRWGGAITAALFLKRWVEVDRWAHLDIAGPAFTESDDDLSPEGGTGFGVSTLVEYVMRRAGS